MVLNLLQRHSLEESRRLVERFFGRSPNARRVLSRRGRPQMPAPGSLASAVSGADRGPAGLEEAPREGPQPGSSGQGHGGRAEGPDGSGRAAGLGGPQDRACAGLRVGQRHAVPGMPGAGRVLAPDPVMAEPGPSPRGDRAGHEAGLHPLLEAVPGPGTGPAGRRLSGRARTHLGGAHGGLFARHQHPAVE